MNRTVFAAMTAASILTVGFGACDAGDTGTTTTDDVAGYKGSLGKADSSAEAVFLRFEFDAQLTTDYCWSTKDAIQDQLLYTIGQLNGDRSLGRLDHLDLTDVKSSSAGGSCTISYHARMPVAWGKKSSVPSKYVLKLPRNVSYSGQQKFTEAYKHDCVEWGAHDVDTGSMWYYYRPALSGCRIAAEDIHEITATVSPSPLQTTGKYPEYHKVWEDDRLEVVAVFGKYEDGKTSGDVGIDGYNRFVEAVRSELKTRSLVTVPATLPTNPGVANPDVELTGTLADGRTVHVVALLVDNVRTAGATFDRRYESLSGGADLIIYNGHAGLGANIRALAQKGDWKTGQYVIVFMNGCDTYAYIDSALAEAHADVNEDDPIGTKYVDLVSNAQPSFFRSMPAATMAMVRGLLSYDAPKTYEQIFGGIDSAEVVLVTGENDNVYVPGYGEHEDPPAEAWAGLAEGATVKRGEQQKYETPTLPAGRYRFELKGSGDADIYVRVGGEPTLSLYDCRPYLGSSNEVCEVELGSEAPIYVLVDGYATSSTFELVGAKLEE
ncbi:MAG: PPC domain-containing protein [Deltaproteobacteria bacterium]|nr:PPC domain-containing protein [Deltaproteobacteria bacterium]